METIYPNMLMWPNNPSQNTFKFYMIFSIQWVVILLEKMGQNWYFIKENPKSSYCPMETKYTNMSILHKKSKSKHLQVQYNVLSAF